MATRRKPLPKGAVQEIDNALMNLADIYRTVLIVARQPGSDGRLAEVIYQLHESEIFLRKAKEIKPIEADEVVASIQPILEDNGADSVTMILINKAVKKCFEENQ